ncbi:MAG: hypothetical protein ACTHLW_06015 [Verrucomicrobiota bacterium]
MTESKETMLKGIVGIIFPAGGITVSTMSQVEGWLRIASLLVGIAVGVVTFWKLIRKKD